MTDIKRHFVLLIFCLSYTVFIVASPAVSATGKPADAKSSPKPKYGLRAGEKAPDFKVTTFDKKTFDLKNARKTGAVVLVFYRGGWCPFCQRQIVELRQNSGEFRKRKATLAALSVDRVENAKKTYEDKKLDFPLLSDPDSRVLKMYRLMYHLDDPTLKKYGGYGIDVEAASGKKHHVIAVPAVFIIDRKGIIRWAYVNEDYKVRAKIKDILKALDAIK